MNAPFAESSGGMYDMAWKYSRRLSSSTRYLPRYTALLSVSSIVPGTTAIYGLLPLTAEPAIDSSPGQS